MRLHTLATRLTVLLTLLLLVAAANARADGPPAVAAGSQPAPTAVAPPGPPVPVVPATTVPAAPAAAVPAAPAVPAEAVPVPPVPTPTPPVPTPPVPTPPVPTPAAPTPPVPTPPVPTPPVPTPPVPTPAAPTPPVPDPGPSASSQSAADPPAPTQSVGPPPQPAPIPPTPPAPAPKSTGTTAIPTPVPPVPTPVSGPAASNTTSQTIIQVQTSPCQSHCDGGTQIQQASQANTTVQATVPTSSPTDVAQTTTTPGHPTQVQVGCLQDCHGTTTLDTSGLTLGQIEQLLGQLELPPLPPLTTAPGALQNVTQQSSAQSQAGDGGSANQAQIADQANTTIQAGGAPSSQSAGPGIVNQTGQGIWQIQVGCLFDCAGTQQVQQATQSNTTVQDPAGASAVNTVTQLIWQLQIGCLFTCYDAIESQGASPIDSTTVVSPPSGVVAPTLSPAGDGTPASEDLPVPLPAPQGAEAPPPMGPPAPIQPPAAPSAPAAAPPIQNKTHGSVIGARLEIQESARVHRAYQGVVVSHGSASATPRGGVVPASASVPLTVSLQPGPLARLVSHRRHYPHAVARAQPLPLLVGGATVQRVGAVATNDPVRWLGMVLAIAALLALTAGALWLRQTR